MLKYNEKYNTWSNKRNGLNFSFDPSCKILSVWSSSTEIDASFPVETIEQANKLCEAIYKYTIKEQVKSDLI